MGMTFIGQLFLLKLLSGRIVGGVLRDLAKCDDGTVAPDEPMVECLCELLTTIGYTLECSNDGRVAIESVCGRLLELKDRPSPAGTRPGGLYSKRVQFAIQELLDIRSSGWRKKTFKPSAKTKEEIRREQEQYLRAQAWGMDVSGAEVKIVGKPRHGPP